MSVAASTENSWITAAKLEAWEMCFGRDRGTAVDICRG